MFVTIELKTFKTETFSLCVGGIWNVAVSFCDVFLVMTTKGGSAVIYSLVVWQKRRERC